MAGSTAPRGLGARGRKLWKDITDSNELDPSQVVILEEACRTADRLDGLDDVIQGKGVLELMHFRVPDRLGDDGVLTVHLTVDGALSEARQQANILKQLLVSLRLPDEATGKKPQARGARGSYTPKTGRVTAIESARRRSQGA